MNSRAFPLKKWSRRAILLLALCLPGLSFAAGAALDRIVERGVLKVAMSGDQQPFNFVYGKNKSVVGFDVDLANELARLMHVELEIVTMPFNDLIGAVQDGSADMAISGMTITASRTRNVTFVGPYVLSGKTLLASNKVVNKLRTPGDFNESGIKLAALKGSTSESLVRQELPRTSLTTVVNYDEGIRQLLAGKVDGMVADMPILALTVSQHPKAKLQLVTPPLSIEPMGIVIAKGDPQLENVLRNFITVFEKTGLLLNLYKKWFEIGNGNL